MYACTTCMLKRPYVPVRGQRVEHNARENLREEDDGCSLRKSEANAAARQAYERERRKAIRS